MLIFTRLDGMYECLNCKSTVKTQKRSQDRRNTRMPSSEAIQRPRPVPIEWPSSWRVANCSASQVGAPGSQVGALCGGGRWVNSPSNACSNAASEERASRPRSCATSTPPVSVDSCNESGESSASPCDGISQPLAVESIAKTSTRPIVFGEEAVP